MRKSPTREEGIVTGESEAQKGNYSGAISRLIQAPVNPLRSVSNYFADTEATTHIQKSTGGTNTDLEKDYRPVEINVPAEYIRR